MVKTINMEKKYFTQDFSFAKIINSFGGLNKRDNSH